MEHYLRTIAHYKPLTRGEESVLAVKIRDGDRRALEKLVKHNLRFVASVARTYLNQGVPFEDLVSAGNLGLMRAARDFNESKNFKFVSYAVWWIRHEILNCLLTSSRILRVPQKLLTDVSRVNEASARFAHENRRQPEDEEVAASTGLTLAGATAARQCRGSVHVSIDTRLPGTGGLTIESSLESPEPLPDEHIERWQERKHIRSMVNATLTPHQHRAITELYSLGKGDDAQLTCAEAGRRLGVTRERVRQLRTKALVRLREQMRGAV